MLSQLKQFVDRLRGGASDRADGRQTHTGQFDEPAARLDHARSLADSEHYARAAHHFEEVLSARPADAAVHREYADLLAATGYHESAARHYERALDLEPDASVHEEFAALLAEKGETRKAAHHHERARARRAS
jgi:Tfp pilus assembly protein PilF